MLNHNRRGDGSLARRLPQSVLAPAVIAAGLFLITACVFEKHLVGRWTFPWDFVGAYTTAPAFVAASVAGGHLLSWSPFVASGFPTNVDPQAGMYFPGWWVLGALDIPATLRVLNAVQVAHVLFGSIGVMALARVRGLKWSWCALAAVAYLFFGGFYAESEHADIVRDFSYTPWLLWTLTPPREGGPWLRLIALPPLIWVIATGGYPAQLASLGITGFVYLAVGLKVSGAATWRRYRVPLALALVAGAATCLAVLLPYLRAEHAHELHRVYEPTAAVRAGASLSPLDLLGLYLNNFAWTYDGTVTAWAVGIPILIGLACARLQTLRRHAPLVASGAVALALAMTPRIGIVGRAMVALGPLFASRFPAADYKASAAVAIIILAADAWSVVAVSRRGLSWSALAVGLLLLAGALFAPSTYAQPTRELWLVIAVIILTVAMTAMRTPPRVLAALLLIFVVIDGVREINDYLLLGRVSPWQASPTAASAYLEQDITLGNLPTLLKQAPARRPARVPPAASLTVAPTGTDPDASGWIANGYHLDDYGGTIEQSLWRVEHNSAWLKLMLQPWNGYTFPCDAVGCRNGAVRLPATSQWRASQEVRTVAYGTESIRYVVKTSQPVLMVENELAVPGWRTNSSKVQPVNAGIPLRTWRLSAGSYSFTATFHEGGRTAQYLAVLAALIAWVASMLMLLRRRKVSDPVTVR